ncbi:FkbM family methyltransferase [Niveispirillum sp. KHB5.9]|uniref:FkbM family methyltransferase n=1 Tax=Niveispirillum sp. KHB5.9 TaxID=3400269 RepID=UPI003A88EBD1
MREHPIFERFDMQIPHDEEGFHVNNVGVRTSLDYDKPLVMERLPGMLTSGAVPFRRSAGNPHLPEPLSEDYYEWIDLLTAIAEAKDHFVMIELGAGYGRWLANAAKALDRFRGPRIGSRFFCGVEMQGMQFQWLQSHLDLNGVTAEQRLLLHTGVSDAVSYEIMELRKSTDYSTAIQQIPGDILKKYYEAGEHLLQVDGVALPYLIIKVVPLSDVLREAVGQGGVVDFMTIDIQGAELRAIEAAIDPVSRQVKRMHIGTHARDIEDRLRPLLEQNGWIIDRFYAGEREFDAEFGRFYINDGILSCRNSRFIAG